MRGTVAGLPVTGTGAVTVAVAVTVTVTVAVTGIDFTWQRYCCMDASHLGLL
jgi:hypothetical protein